MTDRRTGAPRSSDTAAQTAIADMLRRLVAFDTTSRNSNLALIDFVRDHLRDLGIDSHLIADDTGRKANVYATIGRSEGGGLMLSGHTDVVPVDDQDWHSDPFALTERDGRLHGRGACDMKGFIAVVLASLPALAETVRGRPLHLAFTFDEEVGCIGATRLAQQLRGLPTRPAFCLIGEPTGMRIVDGHKGRLAMRCHVHGAEGHSAYPGAACNAVEIAADMIARLRRMARRLRDEGPFDPAYEPPHTTVQTGTVHGGVALNIVPRDCTFDFEVRNLPTQDPLVLIAELKSFALGELLPEMRRAAPQAAIAFEQMSHVPGLIPDLDHDLARAALSASDGNATQKVSFGTEAGLYQAAGLRTIVCGPGDIAQAHKPDEFVSIEQLARCRAFLARVVGDICGA